MRTNLILFIILFLICGNVLSIESIVAPFIPWHFKQKLAYGDKVIFIYQKGRSSEDKEKRQKKFLICEYPIIFSYALDNNSPSTHCTNRGDIFKNRDELLEYLGLLNQLPGDISSSKERCPKVTLLNHSFEFSDFSSFILRDLTPLPPLKMFSCKGVKELQLFASEDGELSTINQNPDILEIENGENTTFSLKGQSMPQITSVSSKEKVSVIQNLPCFDEEVRDDYQRYNREILRTEFGTEKEVLFSNKKSHFWNFIFMSGKFLGPLFKNYSRKKILNVFEDNGIPAPDEKVLKNLIDILTKSSNLKEATENMYVFGATLALAETIKNSSPAFNMENGEKARPCEEFDHLCQKLIGPSITSFKKCLEENLKKKKGDDKCIDLLIQKGVGHLAFNISDLMVDEYVDDDKLDYLCLDKPTECDASGCSKDNCRAQGRVILKAKGRKQINKCFKNYDPMVVEKVSKIGNKISSKKEHDLEKRLKACIASGLVTAADYLIQVGGKNKILNVGESYLKDEKMKEVVSSSLEDHFNDQGLKSCFSTKGKTYQIGG